jgi:tetratricopeptide (TPR) repeat protein
MAIAAATLSWMQPGVGLAQATGAKLHGHVNNAAGVAIRTGDVKLTTDKTSSAKDRVYKFTLPIDSDGNYKGAEITPGEYVVTVFLDKKSIDFQEVSLKVGDDKVLNFDMTRAEFIKAMTPEDKAALEEYKKKNAAVSEENGKIANINAVLTQARLDEKNGKADDAVRALKTLTTQKPDEALLWASLGEAELAAGDAAIKAARAAHTPTNDPAILQTFTDSGEAYQKAITLHPTSKKPLPENLAAYYLNLGQAMAKSGKYKEAADAYETSAKTSPTLAGSAYFNEAATFFNAGKTEEAGAAADKAIAADPKRADSYYIKGQTMIGNAKMDPKTNKFVLPPGCLEAYQQYLELDPTGIHSAEVKDLLTNLGQPVKSSFKAGRK